MTCADAARVRKPGSEFTLLSLTARASSSDQINASPETGADTVAEREFGIEHPSR